MTSTGTLLIRPPSTCSSPSITTGGKMPGARVLASTASASGPVVWIFSSARLRLAETQKYGSHRSSICVSLKNRRMSRLYLPPRLNERNGIVMSSNESASPRAGLVHDARRVPAEIPVRADHRAHAGAADGIDRDVQLARARAARRGGRARVRSRRRARARPPFRSGSAPRARSRRRARAARAGDARACGLGATAPCALARHVVAVHEDERDARSPRAAVRSAIQFRSRPATDSPSRPPGSRSIRLTEAALRPGRRARIGLIDDVAMLDLLFGEPLEQPRAAALAIVRLRGARPSEIAIDDGAGQQAASVRAVRARRRAFRRRRPAARRDRRERPPP